MVPLVEQVKLSGSAQELPTEVASRLDSAQLGHQFHHGNYLVEVGRSYTSALGGSCWELLVTDTNSSQSQQRIACQQGSRWLLVPEIADRSDSELIFNATY
ncbi:hypothetical protein SAMN02745129_2827 [Ferrimonas marina]|uniref:Uncharacterized protein n=1 Tax=Ferrimonas marina TaxID=299255 RepID=A0A1M5VKI9_9GAMM|nr:hypothetical protein SAMN02745129_2827 [Ferrimonas marina]